MGRGSGKGNGRRAKREGGLGKGKREVGDGGG